jgi:DNA end-binding protein Ku
VKVYAASNATAAISFNLLHGKDASRLKQQYICSKDGEIVPRDQMVKGYEFSKDHYVSFTNEELKALEEQSTQSIEVVEFVPIEKVDPVYFDKSYYVGPDKGGAKAYALLSKVMQETGRVALARYAARGKQYLVMLRPIDGGIVMQQLLYADEVRPIAEVPIETADVSSKELDLAKLLVEQRATEAFQPETYEDDVKKRVLALIQKKVDGQDISVAPPESGGGQIIDLMEALKASLAKKPEAARSKAASAAEEPPARKPAKRAPGRVASMRTEGGRRS